MNIALINELSRSLNEVFNWNKARIDCFTGMLLSLFKVRTVNLRELALGFPGEANLDSRYRRLQRFFALFHIDVTVIGRWMFQLFIDSNKEFYLIMDRTNWYWGKKNINVFMLSVAYEGAAIPILWHMLDKEGSSNHQEQIALIEDFVKLFGKSRMIGLLGDREFANGEFFAWLISQGLPFYIRIKENSNVRIHKKKLCNAYELFKHVGRGEQDSYGMPVWIFDQKVNIAGSKSKDPKGGLEGELMIVVTNQSAQTAIPVYIRRWEIETLFSNLKSRGFCLEDTHMKEAARIGKLLVLLCAGFAWAHKVGEWRNEQKPIVFKQYCDNKRPQYSYFRYGLDWIRDGLLSLWNQEKVAALFNQLIEFLVPNQERKLHRLLS